MAYHLSKREGFVFALCLLVIIVYAGLNFVFKPLRARDTQLQGKIAVSEKRLKNHLVLLRAEKTVDEEYEKYAPYFQQKLSDEQEMAAILSEIENVANQTGLRIADMKPQRVKKVDFYNSFSAALTVEGGLGVILQFLYASQNIPHLFRVDEIYFEPYSKRDSQLIKCRLILDKALFPSL